MKNYSTLINNKKSEVANLKFLSKLVILALLFIYQDVSSQTTHINPATDGGFEVGATFAANGWTATSGTPSQNQWVCHSGATAGFSGTQCAYITSNTSVPLPPHNYDLNVARRTHLYRDVTIPAGETTILFSYNWIGMGEGALDYLRVWIVPTTFTPTYGNAIGATGSAPTGRILIGNYNNQASWTSTSVNLPTAYAGQTFRLVFEWVNNASLGTQPPAAIDNISLTSGPGPANDNCSNALSLTVNPDTNCSTSTIGTTVGATQSQAACTGTADDDVWYSFIATSTFHFVTVSSSTIINPVLQVFRGNCGSLVSVVCRNADNTNTVHNEVATLTGLTVGDTYFVRVHSQGNGTGQGTFSICVTTIPNPPNDNCPNAIALTVNVDTTCTTSTSGTTIGGTQSQAACSGTADDDVWYSFVATSTFHFVTVSSATMINPVLQVFRGNCGSLVSVVCRNADNTNTVHNEVATLAGLTVGETYFVRVHSQANGTGQGDFSICVTTIPNPSNDNCPNAIALTVNEDAICTTSTSGTTIGGTQSQVGCSGTADDDVWYSFVATSTSHLITVTPGTLNNAVVQVFGGSCGTLTSLLCRNATVSGAETARVNYLTIGSTYFVRVHSFDNNNGNGTFDICVTSPDTVSTSTTSHTTVELVKDILFENSCISVSNITSVTGTNFGNPSGIGYFSSLGDSFPFKNGIVLSTGNANFAGGSVNEATNSGGNLAWLGDSDVQTVMSAVSGSPQTSHNASFIQFDFVPFQDSISFDFLFASNEYGTYQCDFSDTFIFLLTNLSTGVTTNIAVVPSTTTPITVVSIRDQLYNGFCSSVNPSFFGNFYFNNPINAPINFRGATVPLTAVGTVIPGQQYRIKLAIADRADPLFDSAVFIKGSSFSLGEIALGDDLFIVDNTALCYGESVLLNPGLDGSIFDFEWYQDDVLIPGATAPTYNVTEWGDFRVVAHIRGNPGCFVEDEVSIEIFPQVIPLQPRNITRCNFGTPFDLTENNSRLLQLYPEPTFGLNYYTSLVDAQNNTNPILNPESFTETSNPQTIYARVYNIERECYGIRSFVVRRPKSWNGSVNTDWDTATNWTPTGVPTDQDCIIINATSNNPIISGSNYLGNGFNIEVRDGSTLTVEENNHLMIIDQVVVRPTGSLNFENNASLVQVNNVINTGSIRYDRKAFIRRLDYVYWSSPVETFHIASLSPGTPASTRFFWNTTLANTNGGIGRWSGANENMALGKGYIVRGPNSFNTTIQEFTASFNGVPNNGNISHPISRGSYTGADYAGTNGVTITNMDDNFNLIGNPYPSAIRYTDFMAANPDLEGSVRIWTHGTLPSTANGNPFYASFAYNYSTADYIIHNGTGTVTGPETYDGYIPAAQSFFVLMNDGPAATSNVVFTNSMRVSSNNTQFYRNSNQINSDTTTNRIWLDLVAPNSFVSRTLIGYVEGATYEKDRMFDAYTKAGNDMILYSLIDNDKACIQGRPLPFDNNDVVPLGLKVNVDGIYTIAIAAVDGIFSNQQTVYLRDKSLNTVHNLTANPYSFTANTGVYNDRFEILYQDETLGINQIENYGVKVITNERIIVQSRNEQIKEIQVFDMLGRKVNHYLNIDANEISLKEQKTNQALILKITLENEIIVNMKILY